jgi:long-chain acyl-CoA synthetase
LITLNENYLRKELEDTISDIENSAIVKRVRNEINRLINEETGFKAFERIKKFKILQENFQIGEELTQTLKPKRDFIVNKYKDFIEEMFEGKHKKK